MKYVKYNDKGSAKYSSVVSSTTSGTNSNSRNNDRVLWGNDDDGTDISDSIYCSGSIYLTAYNLDDEAEIDEDDIIESDTTTPSRSRSYESRSDDTGGNIYTQGYIECGSFKTDSGYSRKSAFDYNNVRTDLETDQKRQDTNITNNTNNIANLTTRVVNVENSVTNLNNRVSNVETTVNNCHAQCMKNAADIEELRRMIEELINVPETKKYAITFLFNSNLLDIQVTGTVADGVSEILLDTKTYNVEENRQISYIATAKNGYTFGMPYGDIERTTSGTFIANANRILKFEPVLWRGEQIDAPLQELLKIEVGCYTRPVIQNEVSYEIWLRATTDYENITIGQLTTEGQIDWYSTSNTSAKHDFGGNPTIPKSAILDGTPVRETNTYSSNEWPSPVGATYDIMFSTGYSSGTFTGTVINLYEDPQTGRWG